MIAWLTLWGCAEAPRAVDERGDVATAVEAPAEVDPAAVVRPRPARRLEPYSALHLPGRVRAAFRADDGGFSGGSDDGRVSLRGSSAGVDVRIDGLPLGPIAVTKVGAAVAPGPWSTACGEPAVAGCDRQLERRWGDVIEWWRIEEQGIRLGFHVPEASASELAIQISAPGAESGPDGTLRLRSGRTSARWTAPRAWDARREEVPVAWRAGDDGAALVAWPKVGGRVEIDPVLVPDDEQNRYTDSYYIGMDFKAAGNSNGDGFADSVVEEYGGRPNIWMQGSNVGWEDSFGMSQKLSYFGSSSGGHDVNGDGLDDIVQCEVDFDGHLFLGTLGGKPVESRAYHGTMPGGEKCYDAENADVNGDGYGDVVFSDLGLSQAQAGHPNSYGWIYVYPGGPGFATATPLPMPAFPGKRNQGFGATLAKADFNGDGYEDIASVGVGCASPYLRGDSDAWIFLGGPTGLSSAVWSWRAHVPGPGCELVQVEASPDINGDGFDELLLWGEQGAWWVPGSATGAGDPVAFPHRTHVDTGYPFYYKANAAGDINADGYGDLLLLDADGVHVHLGGPDGPQENVWGVPTWNGRVLGAFSSLDWWAFGPLGDVNGDGYDDFGVGNRDVNTEPGDGIALLFFGRPEPDIDLDGVPNALDCQPYRWWSNQYAPELPGNAYDDDCDSTFTCFLDLDGDGDGGATSLITLPFDGGSCADAGYLDAGPDCHDDDPALGPQTPDVPDDDVDQDCDGWLACHLDLDDDGWGALYVTDEVPAGASCQADPAFLLDDRDCDDTLASTYPGAPDEPANHHDDDCDGDVACWVDADLDGYGDPTTSIESPDLSCQHIGMSDVADCDDTRFAVRPDFSEVVGNGLDDNCDGWYGCFDDLDGDGYGVPWAGGRARQDAQTPDCAVPNRSATSDDCDDARPDVHPGALERPYDVDLIDADCDGWELCYPGDLDGDRYAPPGAPAPVLVQSGAWVCPLGYGGWTTDCAEGDPTISPGTPEVSSNGVDEDCDGLFACSPDGDGDGFTSMSRHQDQATPCRLQLPSTDCDDEDPTVYPGVAEQINDHDDDCDGLAICVDDLDYDDFPGTPVTVSLAMGQVCEDVDLYGELTDCDDHLSRIRPTGAEDPFTARDENCDGLPGSNLQATWLDATTLQLQAVGSPQGATVVLLGSMTGPGAGPCARALRGQCAGLLSPFVVQPTRTPNDANKATWTLHVPRAAAGRTAWWQVWNLRPTEVLGTPVVAVTVP